MVYGRRECMTGSGDIRGYNIRRMNGDWNGRVGIRKVWRKLIGDKRWIVEILC